MLQLLFAIAFSAAPLTLYVPPMRSLSLFVETVEIFLREAIYHTARAYPRWASGRAATGPGLDPGRIGRPGGGPTPGLPSRSPSSRCSSICASAASFSRSTRSDAANSFDGSDSSLVARDSRACWRVCSREEMWLERSFQKLVKFVRIALSASR
ncbi:hypothetical protein EJ110_NYTH23163 [Nymphaea thermarum]|nr:hypothetical protein EJ110_NYTH23163 [Nymphaea thermarum]